MVGKEGGAGLLDVGEEFIPPPAPPLTFGRFSPNKVMPQFTCIYFFHVGQVLRD